jgi:glycosyltransferase involved in cell wall biosynthesis
MIYVCIPSYNEAPTIGLLLWKVRQVFAGFPREYQLLVLDDGSNDGTGEVLERYTRVLPLTVIRHEERRGYAASIEDLLRQAVERTDRPKRDSAILMHADFAHGPNFIPDLVRRIESGADIVIAQSKLEGEPSRARRWVRRLAPVLLRGVVSVPGVSDLVSGFSIFRLVALRNAFRNHPAPLLSTQGWAASSGGDHLSGGAPRPDAAAQPDQPLGRDSLHPALPCPVASSPGLASCGRDQHTAGEPS